MKLTNLVLLIKLLMATSGVEDQVWIGFTRMKIETTKWDEKRILKVKKKSDYAHKACDKARDTI